MKHLLYCILRDPGDAGSFLSAGIGSGPVSLISHNGIAAAFSMIGEDHVAAERTRLLAYARVIEAFNNRETVLPLRFGCFLETKEQIVELLQLRHAEFRQSLDEVAGCVEMGLRIQLPEENGLAMLSRDPERNATGTAYLLSRKARFAEEDWRRRQGDAVLERIRQGFQGLFVKWNAEPCTPGRRHLALYFLIQRSHGELFREAFREVQNQNPEKLLLSGPWPPYNFAACKKDRCLP